MQACKSTQNVVKAILSVYGKRTDGGVLLGLRVDKDKVQARDKDEDKEKDKQPAVLIDTVASTISAAFPADSPHDVRNATTRYVLPSGQPALHSDPSHSCTDNV